MKIGIMQPYFVPYVGYWQLMNAVDKYVIYDDVNFIRSGWIYRNRILLNGQPKYFNIPMLGASQNKLINEVGVNNDSQLIQKNLLLIESAYSKAPFFSEIYPLIKEILTCGKNNIAEFIEVSFSIICKYLDIKTELIISSTLKKNCSLRGQDKILEICKLLDATEYYNAIGGRELYSYKAFQDKGIRLKFLKTNELIYKQFDNEFQRDLSIIDVMMFNSSEQIHNFLNNYTLIENNQ